MTGPFSLILVSGGVADILSDMLLVLVSAKLLGELSVRLGQPAIVGELFAGLLVGPAVLGWVLPSEYLMALGELGVLFLLFRVGLELRDFDLPAVGPTALLVAVLGVAIPFVAGYAVMLGFGQPLVPAIFVGAAMVATSVGITARVLESSGHLHDAASRIILAAAVADDILGLIVLAAVSSLAKGTVNVIELGVTAGMAVGFTWIVATWGSTTLRIVAPRVHRNLRAGDGEFTLALIVLLGLSLIAAHAGVAAIIGAFLAGMALAKTASEELHQMVNGITLFVVPFFLAGIGLHMDLTLFRDPSGVKLALAILVTAVFSKFAGCGLGAHRLGWTGATRVGAGMIPRGEVGMVVAQIGLGLGVIAPLIYGIVVFMSIATTMIAPPLIKIAYRRGPTTPMADREVST